MPTPRSPPSGVSLLPSPAVDSDAKEPRLREHLLAEFSDGDAGTCAPENLTGAGNSWEDATMRNHQECLCIPSKPRNDWERLAMGLVVAAGVFAALGAMAQEIERFRKASRH